MSESKIGLFVVTFLFSVTQISCSTAQRNTEGKMLDADSEYCQQLRANNPCGGE